MHDHELPKFGLSCFFFYDNYYYTVAVFFYFSEDKDDSVDCNRDFNTFGNSEDIDKNLIINRCKLNETCE